MTKVSLEVNGKKVVKEIPDHTTLSVFLREILKYIPDITNKDLTPRIAGVRAQAVGKDGSLIDDFVFERKEQSLHVLNAPSPAATASLAIGEHIVKEIG